MPESPTKGLITTRAAADRIGVCDRTVRRWINTGVLPAYRVGPRTLRIDPGDLDQIARRVPVPEED